MGQKLKNITIDEPATRFLERMQIPSFPPPRESQHQQYSQQQRALQNFHKQIEHDKRQSQFSLRQSTTNKRLFMEYFWKGVCGEAACDFCGEAAQFLFCGEAARF